MAQQILAFGVEPSCVKYRLRQARYPALAETVAQFMRDRNASRSKPLDLLDVGVGDGCERRYLEKEIGTEGIRYHGVDLFPFGQDYVYKNEDWTFHNACLEKGMPFLESDRFDVVICEQLLEHLHRPNLTAADLLRVLRPDGLLIVGVPIFPEGVHLFRKHLVPVLDRWFKLKKHRSHVQAFTLRTFRNLLASCESPENGCLEFVTARGFRIISGGVLRPLENFRWWWKFNRWLGSLLPALCTEVQIVALKRRPDVLPMYRAEPEPRRSERRRRAA
jgi:SAM-dependent methyltransferase